MNEGELKEGREGHRTLPSQEWYLKEDAEILYGLCLGAPGKASTFPDLPSAVNRKQVVTGYVNWNSA